MKGDLDWIVMKALDKDRRRRYSSAVAMAEDVQRFLLSEPVEACPPSAAYRFSKFTRRHKVVLATLSVIVTTMVIGTIVSLYQTSVAIGALAKARAAETEAIASRSMGAGDRRLSQGDRLG